MADETAIAVTSDQFIPRPKRGQLQLDSFVYGRSRDGTPLMCWIGNGRGNHTPLVIAAVHGDEPETSVLLSTVARSLQPATVKVAIVLAANPDGLARGTRGNAAGVDLNRNFPATNWTDRVTVSRWDRDGEQEVQLSPGTTPGSEPETAAIIRLIDALQPPWIIALHAPLACIDDPNGSQLGQWLSTTVDLPLVPRVDYPTPGSLGTWAAEAEIPLITYELEHASIDHLRGHHMEAICTLVQRTAPGS